MGAFQAREFNFHFSLPKLRSFTFPRRGFPSEGIFTLPPAEASLAREFSLFPPVGASQAGEFSLFPRVGAPQARELSLSPPVGASQAREFSLFPAVTASQAIEFSLFPPLGALQAAELQMARQRRLDSPPNPMFFECVSMFLQWFPSKHGNLHFCRHKTGRKHHVRQCFQFPYLSKPLNIPLFTVFSSIFPCSNAGSQLQHIYKKSFQNIVFDSVFPMFPVKHAVIYTFLPKRQ